MVGNIQCNAEGGREWTEDMKTLPSLSFPFHFSLSPLSPHCASRPAQLLRLQTEPASPPAEPPSVCESSDAMRGGERGGDERRVIV